MSPKNSRKLLIAACSLMLLFGCTQNKPVTDTVNTDTTPKTTKPAETKVDAAVADSKKLTLPSLTMEEYFLKLPNKYFNNFYGKDFDVTKRKAELRKSTTTVDEKNYYLTLNNNSAGLGSSSWTMTIFLSANQEPTIAIDDTQSVEWDFQDLWFLQYKNGKWIDVTEPVFGHIFTGIKNKEKEVAAKLQKAFSDPDEDLEFQMLNVAFILPKEGTTIQYMHGGGGRYDYLLFNITWKNGKFVLENV